MRSLRTQFSLVIMLIVLLTVVLISFLSNVLINRDFEAYITRQQHIKAADIADNLGRQYNSISQEWDIGYIHGIGMSALDDGYIVKVFDANRNSVWDAESHDMSRCTKVMEDIIALMEQRRPNMGGQFASQEYELKQNGQKVGFVTVSYYGPFFLSENDFRFMDALNRVLIIIGGSALVFSFLVGSLLAKRIVRPIIKTAHIAKQISNGNYDTRFHGQTKSKELDKLIDAVNHMAASLGEQEKLRKQLTTDVAHELRTPLSAIGSHLEAMLMGVWEPTPERLKSCHEEVQRLSALVSDLERLAEAESDVLMLDREKTDLLEIARTVSINFEAETAKKHITLTVKGEKAEAYIDKDRISQVITNLLSNAVKYTSEGGAVEIVTHNEDAHGVLVVRDTGSGIPEWELPFIFERFYRSDKSRNRATGGAGIGLTIAKSIVTAHGGTITAESESECGSTFTVKLPK